MRHVQSPATLPSADLTHATGIRTFIVKDM